MARGSVCYKKAKSLWDLQRCTMQALLYTGFISEKVLVPVTCITMERR